MQAGGEQLCHITNHDNAYGKISLHLPIFAAEEDVLDGHNIVELKCDLKRLRPLLKLLKDGEGSFQQNRIFWNQCFAPHRDWINPCVDFPDLIYTRHIIFDNKGIFFHQKKSILPSRI